MTTPVATASGLGAAEAAARLVAHGPNTLPIPSAASLLTRILRLGREPMTVLLLAAALASITVLGDRAEGLAILAILVVNGVVQTVQEGRADRAVRALRDLSAPHARVLRDGAAVVIDAAGVVPGDVVLLAAGDRVPADLVLTEAVDLAVEEAALTGEAFPAAKRAGAALPGLPYGDRVTEAFAGTMVVSGRGTGTVTATGAATAVGTIGGSLGAAPRTPLEREMRSLARRLALVAVAVGVVLVPVAAVRADGEEALVDAVLAGAALAVAAIPEGLIAIVTTALAVGAQRMARGGAIVRRLASLEALGAASVLCVDKTGTLTTGDLTVVGWETPPGAEEAMWAAAARCSDDGGDPVDAALLAAAGERPAGRRVRERPFSSETRYQAAWDETRDGVVVSVKGAPEVVLARCRPGPERALVEGAAARLASAGRRVLALAGGPADAFDTGELRPLGVVAFADPLRESTAAAVADCRRAGLRVVLVTGDHAETAAAVARQAGLRADTVVSGADLTGGAARRNATLVAADVVARVDPSVKLDLVRAHRAAGAVVAMTGDGVNDAPALRNADVGVAIAGEGGTDIAREAAALVVTDGDLGAIVRAVAEGRRIYRNLTTAVAYLVTGNLSEILVVAGGLLLVPELAVPLLPIQLLWVNLVTDGLPALALAVDDPPGDALDAPPRAPGDTILGRRAIRAVTARAGLVAALVLGAAALARRWGWTPDAVRTVIVATLVPSHLVLAYVSRGSRRAFEPGWARNRLLLAAVAGSVVLQGVLLAVAPLRSAFGLAVLPPVGWLLAAGVPAVLVAVTDVARRIRTGAAR
ncbi:MAG TPA: cation-transporting P-type ATPase [Frankiaceae bacterium]|nr:cation-transporting P-type ATPase [Frankiaceae bacterium]